MKQFPVYLVSEVLTGSKRFYSKMEKVAYICHSHGLLKMLSLLWSKHSHSIPSTTPSKTFKNNEGLGRIRKWPGELTVFIINYTRRTTIKSQARADLITDPNRISFTQSHKGTRLISMCSWSLGASDVRIAE
jgi:putative intracellular protease/amidase